MPIKQILALILSFYKILFPFAVDAFTNSGDKLMYEWSADMEFTEEYFIELEKAPDRDFKILNLTDIQVYDDELYHESENGIGHDCLAIVKKVIEDEQPDLITVSGDSFCSTLSTLETIEVIDAFGYSVGTGIRQSRRRKPRNLAILGRISACECEAFPLRIRP